MTVHVDSSIKQVLRQMLGERALGGLDYCRHPEKGIAWGGPFNGQAYRQALFLALVNCFPPAAIVETGTYLGTTTEFMASVGVPVFTIEGQARTYGFARARLRRQRHVNVTLGDSRMVLEALFNGPLAVLAKGVVFAYLDAHWNADLPLAQELETIFSRCQSAIVMVDDFKVPGDAGYGYDDYGPARALDASYIAPVVARHALKAFYPSTPSAEETGMKRGCVVLAKTDTHGVSPLLTRLLRTVEVEG